MSQEDPRSCRSVLNTYLTSYYNITSFFARLKRAFKLVPRVGERRKRGEKEKDGKKEKGGERGEEEVRAFLSTASDRCNEIDRIRVEKIMVDGKGENVGAP